MNAITETPAWAALQRHRSSLETISVRELFTSDGQRFDRFSLSLGDLLVDFSKNRVTAETLSLLVDLAEAAELVSWRDRLFAGEPVNMTESRPALHVALRNLSARPIPVDGTDVMPQVRAGLERIKSIAEGVRRGGWRAADRGPITHVVHLGIGGSGLGPALVCAALAPQRPKSPHVSFVSNVDGTQLSGVLAGLDPSRTLIVVASKSFRTVETLTNAASARDWLEERLGPRALGQHMALGRFHPVDVPVLGDVGVTARELTDRLGARDAEQSRREVANRWEIWRAEKASRRHDDRGQGISAASLFDALTRTTPADAVMAVDVGNNTYSFGRYFEVDRQSVLMSGYLGSIGFGYPAAMGAWAAVGDRRKVLAITGDGGFGQYAMETTTAVKYGMDITHVLMNNGELGKITKEQKSAEFDVWQTQLHNPDFSAFAALCGAHSVRVTSADDLDAALAEAIAHDGPSMVEVVTDALLV